MPTSLPVHTPTRTRTIALVGNPNTGKSTLFNALTGFRQRVGNYPGVTVERRSGTLRTTNPGPPVEVLDLPGTYSLAVHQADEAIVLDVLLGHHDNTPPDVIVCVLDAANLQCNLFLTTQVLELDRPVVIALNMYDVAEELGIAINLEALEQALAVPVVPVVAVKQVGVERLRNAIENALQSAVKERHCHAFPDCVCAELDGLCTTIRRGDDGPTGPSARAEAMQSLLTPGGYHETRLVKRCGLGLAEELTERRARIAAAGESVAEVEARVRYAWIDRVVKQVVTHVKPPRSPRSERADRILTHPVAGIALLLLLMGLGFQVIYTWAQPVMDAIDGTFSALGALLSEWLPAGPVESLLANGVVAGVGAVLTFLPQIVILFLFIAVLEDCGYMARAAFLLDRWMALLGLNGKSFIPLLSSYACAVPGIMATRTIESRRDRMVTILIAPLMSCSARLPVYVLLIGAFIPSTPVLGRLLNLQAVTLLAMYLVGVVIAIPIALLLKKTVLRGEPQGFLLELPTYKWPSPTTAFYRAYEQGREFAVSAGTIIFAVTIVVWAMGYYPHPASVAADFEVRRTEVRARYEVHAQRLTEASGHAGAEEAAYAREQIANDLAAEVSELDRQEAGEYLRQSVLGRLGRRIEPLVMPLGWDWRIGTAAMASFPAREVFVATMGTIYNLGGDQDESSTSLRDTLRSAAWPDGRPVFNVAVALSVMVFFALCCQCAATLAVIKRETNSWTWPLATFTYMTLLAYLGALVTYQVASRLIHA